MGKIRKAANAKAPSGYCSSSKLSRGPRKSLSRSAPGKTTAYRSTCKAILAALATLSVFSAIWQICHSTSSIPHSLSLAAQDAPVPACEATTDNLDGNLAITENKRRHMQSHGDPIPLPQLVATGNFSAQNCPVGTTFVPSRFLDNAHLPPRKIPHIVHITGKQPCMTPAFYSVMQKWHLKDHSFAFHDDAAVDRLLAKFWPEFPHLQLVSECLLTGAAKADLWRYLVLYEYGGIYSDMDAAPGKLFLGKDSIQAEDDAYLVVEVKAYLAQLFMATSPKHPIMFLSVLTTLEGLYSSENVLEQDIPLVTGPGALKRASRMFVNSKKGFPKAGLYTGMDNRTVRVVGKSLRFNEYILRNAVVEENKMKGFQIINQSEYRNYAHVAPDTIRQQYGRPCVEIIHEAVNNKKR